MIELFKLDHSLFFPSHHLALEHPNGLLAFGGDLSPERLLEAYRHGIFPWYSDGEPILWWTPNPRGVIYTETFAPSRSLKKSLKRYGYVITMNHAFEQVIHACANIPRRSSNTEQITSTWITEPMLHAYIDLHYLGYAHSIEVWNDEKQLCGGLYGVGLNHIFCGESMFHRQTDASKVALWALVTLMRRHNMPMIDCQMTNPHLNSLGCVEVERSEFLRRLDTLVTTPLEEPCWKKQTLCLN